uniref:Uncharacterized protein n=1 Tax=Rhipicephalus zambeziensis TaxID=60191 RepID=A0A224Y6C5_9ACAR
MEMSDIAFHKFVVPVSLLLSDNRGTSALAFGPQIPEEHRSIIASRACNVENMIELPVNCLNTVGPMVGKSYCPCSTSVFVDVYSWCFCGKVFFGCPSLQQQSA